MLIAALVLGLVVVNDTFALMTAPAKSVINTFSIAEIDTGIDETLTEGNKQVSITNQGPSDAYIRARIMVSGVTAEQVSIVVDEPQNLESEKVYLVMKNNGDTNGKWYKEEELNDNKYSEDFYYYLGVVTAKGSTSNLLEKVVFGSALESDQEFLAGFNITVYHESVLAIEKPGEGQNPDLNMVKRAFTNAVPTTNPGT